MKKLYLFFSTTTLLFTFLCTVATAQITVTPSQSATVLANKLVGSGITLLNPTLTCNPAAEGIFQGLSTLSFDSGIVLSSGQAIDARRPASYQANSPMGTPGDPQLTTLAGQPTNDACILEFDFRPTGDTIKFDYVFGSEEYTDYTCDIYNDVFGFFINGPGIAGIRNIALVPGTNIPVCINSVNCGATGLGTLSRCQAVGAGSPFCTYYVNNSAGTTIVYDGLTKTLQAISPVTPCDTYHLKIGIADAYDDILDSGVFLKAGSLKSTSFSVASQGVDPSDTGFGSQYAIRGCTPGMFIFENTGDLNDSVIVRYVIGGTAVNGYDYSTIIDSTIIHTHQQYDTVFINGLTTATGTKTVELYIISPYPCGAGVSYLDSVQLTIYDSFNVHITTHDTAICIGQDAQLNATGSNALNYSWSPAATLSSTTILNPIATPTVTTTYTLVAGQVITGCPSVTKHITVTVAQPPTLDIGPAIKNICKGVPLQINLNVSPSGSYTYDWTPTTDMTNTGTAHPTITPSVVHDTVYTVTVTPSYVAQGCTASTSFTLHVLPNDFTLISQDTGICKYDIDSFQIRAEGDTEFTYLWTPAFNVSNPNITDPKILPPGVTSQYVLTASYPGCPNMVHGITFSIEDPHVNIVTSDTTVCIDKPVPITVFVTPADSPYTFAWSPTAGLIDSSVLETSFYEVEGVYRYYLTVTSGIGCHNTDSVTYHAHPPIHIIATPLHSTINYGQELQLQATLISMGETIYWTWSPNDATVNNPNINNPMVTPTEATTVYKVNAIDLYGCRDSATVIVDLEHTNECIPSAFTPNGDGLNDVFRLCNLTSEKLVDFSVYNRWGNMVYHNTTDATKGWDGTWNGAPQDLGVYSYQIIVARVDGTNKIYKGDVTLIR